MWYLSQDGSFLLPFNSVGHYSAPLGADLYYFGADLHTAKNKALSHSSPQKRGFVLRAIGHHRFLFCPQLPIAEIMFQMNLVVMGVPFCKPLLMDWRLYLGQITADNIGVFTTLSLAHEERQAEKKSSGYCISPISAQFLKWGCHSEKRKEAEKLFLEIMAGNTLFFFLEKH